MSLALAVIAKDEVEQVRRIVTQYAQYFDEIAVAVDERLDDFQALASDKVTIYPYEWRDDFSHKRNFLASQIKSPYYFRLDTDDEIVNAQIIPVLFRRIVDDGIDVYYCMYDYAKDENGNVIARHWRETIVRKREDIYWKKAIHENVFIEDLNAAKLARDTLLSINHNIDTEHVIASSKRNFEYLVAEFKRDGENTDPRTLAYLGRMLMGRREYQKAILFLETLVKKSGWDDDKYFAWIQMSQCYQSLGNMNLALACCNEALALNTKFPDAYIQMGIIYLDNKEFDKAVDWIMPGIVRPIPDTVMVIDPHFYNVKGKMAAALALLGKGDITQAMRWFQEAKKASPRDTFILGQERLFTEALETDTYIRQLAWLAHYTQAKEPAKLAALVDSIPSTVLKDERAWAIRNKFVTPRKHGDNEVAIFCGAAWEEWTPANVLTGLGGSEEAVVYLSRELVKLGYKVTVYNSCGDFSGDYDGVTYLPFYAFNPRDTFNFLVAWRVNMLQGIKAKKTILWLHDIPMKESLGKSIFNNVVVLSAFHKTTLPETIDATQIKVSSNGINLSDFDHPPVQRNPHRLIYTSSYDRGIEHLLKLWPEIRSAVPDAELHLFYGWNTYDEMMKAGRRRPEFKEYLTKLIAQDGVFEHGRVGHRQLAKELAMSGLWVYPSHFEEISCISAMKAQAAGCVPVCTDYAALKETVKVGVIVPGKAGDSDVSMRYKEALIEILKDEGRQEEIRQQVLQHKESFGWDKVAQHWQEDILSPSPSLEEGVLA